MDEMLKTLNGVCSFKSIAERTDNPDYPYGEETNKALKYMLDTCEGFGFRVKNLDNQLGYAEIGEGDELFGILAHLDVVPTGKGWDYEPFAATLDNGVIYGRGVVDDKGPAVAAVYAMKDVLESGRKLNKRIRIIFGQTEEAGEWDDMDYYVKHDELPAMGITPDASFPAIYGEKGIFHFFLKMPKDKAGIVSISGGQAPNMVADEAKAIIDINGTIRDFYEQGVAAHGSLPEEGKNAISMLFDEIGQATENCGIANFYNKYIGFDIHGERIGAEFEDEESGKLTLNVGMVYMDEEYVVLNIDIRYPVTMNVLDITRSMEEAIKGEDVELELDYHQLPVYMDKDGELIKKLESVYRRVTGLGGEAMVIGGGTYARAMPNIVAYGPMLPGRETTEHQGNERISYDDFLLLREVYREALLEICAE